MMYHKAFFTISVDSDDSSEERETIIEDAVFIPQEQSAGLKMSDLQRLYFEQNGLDLAPLSEYKWRIMIFPGLYSEIGQATEECTINRELLKEYLKEDKNE